VAIILDNADLVKSKVKKILNYLHIQNTINKIPISMSLSGRVDLKTNFFSNVIQRFI